MKGRSQKVRSKNPLSSANVLNQQDRSMSKDNKQLGSQDTY